MSYWSLLFAFFAGIFLTCSIFEFANKRKPSGIMDLLFFAAELIWAFAIR